MGIGQVELELIQFFERFFFIYNLPMDSAIKGFKPQSRTLDSNKEYTRAAELWGIENPVFCRRSDNMPAGALSSLGKIKIKKNKNGYVALFSVVFISALLILIATSANLLSIGESDMSLQENQSWEASYLAVACAEDALMKLKGDPGYSGDETLNFNSGSCRILPIESGGDENRIIKTSSNAYNQVRKIKIEISKINPKIQLKSWQPVADF